MQDVYFANFHSISKALGRGSARIRKINFNCNAIEYALMGDRWAYVKVNLYFKRETEIEFFLIKRQVFVDNTHFK